MCTERLCGLVVVDADRANMNGVPTFGIDTRRRYRLF